MNDVLILAITICYVVTVISIGTVVASIKNTKTKVAWIQEYFDKWPDRNNDHKDMLKGLFGQYLN